MNIDYTISIGNIITAIGFVASAIIFGITLKIKLEYLHKRVTEIENNLKAVAENMFLIARQDERIKILERMVLNG